MKKFITILAVGFAMLLGNTAHAQEMLQIKGSDTLINLVQRLAEVYMEENPGKYIAVTGGGSGTGIAALINEKCDIANASRVMKSKEITMAQERNVMPKRLVIALDGLSVIINPNNPVSELTKDQIGAIFRGDIKNWKEVGGPDQKINLYGRQSNSGTFVFFQDFVLKGDYSQKMKRMNGNAQIVEAIRNDSSGIGYVGVGYLKSASDLKVVRVAATPGGEYASPLNAEDVKSGKYPLVRPLNQYVDGSPSAAVAEFLSFEMGPRGQEIVLEEGFFPITAEYKELNSALGI